MSRKPSLKPGTLSREELLERRISDLERMVRRFPARSVQGGSDATSNIVQQTTHGLAVGNVIRHNGTIWTKSKADTSANAVVGGIVIAVLSPDVFVMATSGYVAGFTSLTAGSVHYLSASTAGALTTTAPGIAVPIIHADSTTSGILMAMVSGGGASLPSISTWASDDITATGTYTVSDSGGATLCVLEFIGGGGGGGYGPSVAPGGYGGGGGAGGTHITSPILPFAVGFVVTATIGSGGAGGTSGTLVGSSGGNTTVIMDGFPSETADGGLGGNNGSVTVLNGYGAQATRASTPYAQSACGGMPGTYDRGGDGGAGMTGGAYGAGGNGGNPDTGGTTGGAGQSGVIRVWTNGTGVTF